MFSKNQAEAKNVFHENSFGEGVCSDGYVRDGARFVENKSKEDLIEIALALFEEVKVVKHAVKGLDSRLSESQSINKCKEEFLTELTREVESLKGVAWRQTGEISDLKRLNMNLKMEVRELKKTQQNVASEHEDPEQPGQPKNVQIARR